jgi:hypothetical protein
MWRVRLPYQKGISNLHGLTVLTPTIAVFAAKSKAAADFHLRPQGWSRPLHGLLIKRPVDRRPYLGDHLRCYHCGFYGSIGNGGRGGRPQTRRVRTPNP